MATITGNPQNMLIASLSGIRYAPFAAALSPVALFGLAVDALLICTLFRHDLRPGPFEHAGARRHGVQISFWQYFRVGAPVTVLTLLFGIWWL